MNSISNLKLVICALAGAIGSFLAKLFGGWSEEILTLIIFMAVDYITGLIVAGVFKKSNKSKTGALDSHEGWKGLCKKGVMLIFVMVAYRMDILLDTDYIRTMVIIGFVVNEALSIIENSGLMGIPLPTVVNKAIECLKGELADEYNQRKL